MTTELEKARHAKLREAQGKEPKVEPGEKREMRQDQIIFGRLLDLVLGQIAFAELLMGKQMFFEVSTPLKDGRKFTIKLEGQTDAPENLQ